MAANATGPSAVGVAKEVTKGTPVVPSDTIPVTTFDPTHDATELLDEGWRGAPVDATGSQQGKVVSALSIGGPLYVASIGWPLKGILGEEAVSGSGPYPHVFDLLNSGDQQPPALTFTDKVGNLEHRAWPGVQLSEVKLMIDPDGNLTWSGSGVGFPDAAAASFTPAPSAVLPMQGWRVTCNVNGSAAQVSKLDLTMKRSVNAIKTSNGTQSPFAVWVGKLDVSITATVLAESISHITNLAADTQGVFSFTCTRTPGAAATEETLTVTCTKTAYRKVAIKRGEDWLTADLELKPLGNSTDVGTSAGYSPIKVSVTNARSTVY